MKKITLLAPASPPTRSRVVASPRPIIQKLGLGGYPAHFLPLLKGAKIKANLYSILNFLLCFSLFLTPTTLWAQNNNYENDPIIKALLGTDNPNTATNGMYAFDKDGNIRPLHEVTLRGGQQPDYLCSWGQSIPVEFYVDDITQNSGFGFDDPMLGETRLDVLCQVFKDLGELLPAAPIADGNTCAPPILRVHLRPSTNQAPVPDGVMLGAATSVYYNYSTQGGIAYTSSWRVINGGMDLTMSPLISGGMGAFHIEIRVNFNENINWHYDYTTNLTQNQSDFYSTMLHEIIHSLGFASATTAQGQSDLPNGNLWNKYDTYLTDANNVPLLIEGDCEMHTFNPNININNTLLGEVCNSILFPLPNTPLSPLSVYTVKDEWEGGSSVSHIVGSCLTPPEQYIMTAVVTPYQIGDPQPTRHPHPHEVAVLCALGYTSDGSYGNNGPLEYTYPEEYATCGTRLAANDDGVCEIIYAECQPIDIPISSIIANDQNVTHADCFTLLNDNYGSIVADQNTLTYTPGGNNMLTVIAYTGYNQNNEASNTAFIFIIVKGCNCIDTQCDMVCNPDISYCDPPDNEPLIHGINNISSYCPKNDSWSDAVNNAFYFPGGYPYPSPYEDGAFCPVATNANIEPLLHPFEACQTPVQVQAGKKYILTYLRTLNKPPQGFQELDLMNLENIYVKIMPNMATNGDILPNSITVAHEQNVPNDFGATWKKMVTCFDYNEDPLIFENPHLVLYPFVDNLIPIVPNNIHIVGLYIDQVQLIEDTGLPAPQTINASYCGESVCIGDPNICLDMDDLQYTWAFSIDNGQTFTQLDDTNQTQLCVNAFSPKTIYKLTRSFATQSNTATPYTIENGDCTFLETTFTIQLNDTTDIDPVCCQNANKDSYHIIEPFTIASNVPIEWDQNNNDFGNMGEPIRINTDVTVKYGTNITWTNMVFEMGPKGRIIVQKNARLNLNNCTLKGDPICKTMWQGIRVIGPGWLTPHDNIVNDLSKNTGIVYTNGGTIQNALIGICAMGTPVIDLDNLNTTIKDDFFGKNFFMLNVSSYLLNDLENNPNSYASSGGAIWANSTKFHDCFQGINSSRYTKSSNAGNFKDLSVRYCTFGYNGTNLWYPFNNIPDIDFPDKYYPTEAGIVALGRNLIWDIRNNTFSNLKYGIRFNSVKRALIGIEDSNYPEGTNYFKNCRVGISMRNHSSTVNDYFTIIGNDFKECKVGIQTEAANASISYNTIERTSLIPGEFTAGIITRGADLLNVKTNTINTTSVGIYAISCAHGGFIANNTLQNNIVSILAQGNNNNVQTYCNDLSNYSGGITVFPLDFNDPNNPAVIGTYDPIIQKYKLGSCFNDKPCLNTFTNQNNPTDKDVENIGNTLPFVYSDIPATIANISTSLPTVSEDACDAPIATDVCSMLEVTSPSIPELLSMPNLLPQKEAALLQWLIKNQSSTTPADSLTVLQLLKDIKTPIAQKYLTGFYIQNKKTTEADEAITKLEKITADDNNFAYIQTLLNNWEKEQSTSTDMPKVFSITEQQHNDLLKIAQTNTHSAYKAQALLYLTHGYEFKVVAPDLSAWGIYWDNNAYTSFKTDTNTTPPTFTVFPNPAQNTLNISSNQPNNQPTLINILDLSGKIILHKKTYAPNCNLDITNLKNGMYLYQIIQTTDKDQFIQQNKIIILK